MSNFNIEDLTSALADTKVSQSGVSFQGRSLKLDTAESAKEIIDAINNCSKLEYLNLEGNTLGVEAAKAIAKALETRSELKRALWKDMFTGRMKSEIPLALEHLGKALVTAGARLTELDLSDNAFGPIGVEGLASLLRSSSCYNLQELRLNNNGLGITGGKLLAKALMDCYNNSKTSGSPLALKVFIAGRNRLENDGATALAEVFKTIGTLEEIAMPQNGIYHVGITALSDSFTHNKNLQILNLNDNTIGPIGSTAIAKVLPQLQNLRQINFGDCLLKTQGAISIANALKNEHTKLENLTLDSNEIRTKGGVALAKAMHNKTNLKTFIVDANQFGEEGCEELRNALKSSGRSSTLGTLDDDEEPDSEDDSDDEENCKEEDEKSDDEEHNASKISLDTSIINGNAKSEIQEPSQILKEFLDKTSEDAFLKLGNDRNLLIVNEIKKHINEPSDVFIDNALPILMKVASLSNSKNAEVVKFSLELTHSILEILFGWCTQPEKLLVLNNAIIVHLGLLKGEDKKFKITWNLNGCALALESAVKKNYFHPSTKETLKMFMQRFDNVNTVEKSTIKKLEAAL
ncbi:ran GTPase-activating protein 1 [Chrysoperla carnea]|uniref:ran GTPase-activating protein 1 n=1 Tax=Chrysoperla carnea TaxID=189513 RepID=UPI001D091ED1|nr:ran GTPase-activating protein 1 [Chrysoperla carnea]